MWLAQWDVYGNAGPEVTQLLGWDALGTLGAPSASLAGTIKSHS